MRTQIKRVVGYDPPGLKEHNAYPLGLPATWHEAPKQDRYNATKM